MCMKEFSWEPLHNVLSLKELFVAHCLGVQPVKASTASPSFEHLI